MDDRSSENRPLKGLYRNVKISVPALNGVILLCVVLILAVALLGQGEGYTVTFDSRGGTDVPAQTRQYGETLLLPEPPTREGFAFTGWYQDPSCDMLWEPEMTVTESVTLYAGWEKE